MNLAIVHYHLNRGGVTRVIAAHLRSLSAVVADAPESIRVAILYGGRKSGWPDDLTDALPGLNVQLCPVDGLDYDDDAEPQSDRLARRLQRQLDTLGFTPAETVIHAHNHNLGKNISLPGALSQLARSGYPLLLQVHDFAEEFRPANYERLQHLARFNDQHGQASGGTLYPQAPHIGYAVLNHRDYKVLHAAGVPQDRLDFLPNPVVPPGPLPDREAARQELERRFSIPRDALFLLYPVRGIRRKNLGEFLLWSILGQAHVGITLAPLNPAELGFYERWREFARCHGLQAAFGTGEAGGLSFPRNLAAADRILTTSLAEGFGMVFLESWLAGKMLIGRDLPAITADFLDTGMTLHSLQSTVQVPIDWVGRDRYQRELFAAANGLLTAYHRPPLGPGELSGILDEKIQGGMIDFGDLSEPLQREVIARVHCNAAAAEEMRCANSRLWPIGEVKPEVIAKNRQIVEETYGVEPSGQRLLQIHTRLLNAAGPHDVIGLSDPECILGAFLDLTRYRLIRG